MDILEVKIKKAENDNIIIGQAHFIKSVEDIYEAIKNIAPSGEFGIAFNEASTDRLIRYTGTNKEAMDCAIENCKEIAAGHIFCIVLKNIYPIQILNSIKAISTTITPSERSVSVSTASAEASGFNTN